MPGGPKFVYLLMRSEYPTLLRRELACPPTADGEIHAQGLCLSRTRYPVGLLLEH